MNVTGGTTDVTTYFALRLTATGVEATALDVTTFDLQYVRTGTAPVAKVDATALAATDSAHADNKAIEIDATDQPGLYRVDWPDAAFAAGVREVILTVKAATVFTEHLRVSIDAPVDVQKWLTTAVSTPTVAGVPNVNVKTWNDLTTVALPLVPTTAGRTLDVSAGGEAGVDWANIGSPTTTVGLTNTTVGIVTLTSTLTTYTGNTVQTGDSFARIGATGSGLTSLATQASVNTIDDFLDTEVAEILVRLPEVVTGTVNDAGPAVGDFDGDAGLSATNDFYNGCVLVFTDGTNAGIARKISDYVGASKNFAFTGTGEDADAPWVTAPANGDAFKILGRIGS